MENTTENTKKEALTYSELKTIASQQQEQLVMMKREYNSMAMKLQDAMESLMGKRLELLFNVLKYNEFFSKAFVNEAAAAIEAALVSPAQPEEAGNTSKDN